MPNTSNEVLGTVRTDGTLELDEKLSVAAGRVRVRIESIEAPIAPAENLVEFVGRLRKEMEAAGSNFMTDAEVSTWVEDLRSEDDRVGEAYRQGEE